jgi:hypothetical protein
VPLRHLSEAIRQRLADPATGVLAGPPAIPVPVREVHLVRSHLGPGGARYETVARFPLAEATVATASPPDPPDANIDVPTESAADAAADAPR